jgi:putative addiction module component (TIGR02574 family)
MPATVIDLPQDLIDQVRALSPAQKAALRLELDPADPPGDPELKALLTQRWEDYQSGKIKALTMEESDARIRQVLEEFER